MTEGTLHRALAGRGDPATVQVRKNSLNPPQLSVFFTNMANYDFLPFKP